MRFNSFFHWSNDSRFYPNRKEMKLYWSYPRILFKHSLCYCLRTCRRRDVLSRLMVVVLVLSSFSFLGIQEQKMVPFITLKLPICLSSLLYYTSIQPSSSLSSILRPSSGCFTPFSPYSSEIFSMFITGSNLDNTALLINEHVSSHIVSFSLSQGARQQSKCSCLTPSMQLVCQFSLTLRKSCESGFHLSTFILSFWVKRMNWLILNIWFYYWREKWMQWIPRGIILMPLNLDPIFTARLSKPSSRCSGALRRRRVPLERNQSYEAVFIYKSYEIIIISSIKSNGGLFNNILQSINSRLSKVWAT